MKKRSFDVVIIGGGASGLFLASELPSNLSVAILESNDRVGKKLLATGNGKCNLTNLDMNIIHYNKPSMVEGFLDKFDCHDTIATFEHMGLLTKVIDNRVYPYSECATTVLDVLRHNINKNNIQIFTSHFVNFIDDFNDIFSIQGIIKSKDKNFANQSFEFNAKNIVLATGTPASFGRNSLDLYQSLGHTVKSLVPSLVPIKTNKEPIKGLQGVRVKAGVKIGYRYEIGEVLFKNFGISGIAVFNMSTYLARGKAKFGDSIYIDFMPDYSLADVEDRLRKKSKKTVGELMLGTFHSKVIDRILWASDCKMEDLAQNKITSIAKTIKNYKLIIEGLGDTSLCQVMSGGLILDEFDKNLMSNKHKGAYAIGESLDIDGDCGGYNLQWAWTSAKIVANAIKKQI